MKRGRVFAMASVAAIGVAFAGCGSSPEDEARDDGEDVGEAVRAIADASSIEEAQTAVQELKDTVADIDPDVIDRVRSQVEIQRNTLVSAFDAARAAGSFDDARVALQEGAQEMRSQANSFRDGENSIANEFWRGFEEGYDGD